MPDSAAARSAFAMRVRASESTESFLPINSANSRMLGLSPDDMTRGMILDDCLSCKTGTENGDAYRVSRNSIPPYLRASAVSDSCSSLPGVLRCSKHLVRCAAIQSFVVIDNSSTFWLATQTSNLSKNCNAKMLEGSFSSVRSKLQCKSCK